MLKYSYLSTPALVYLKDDFTENPSLSWGGL